MPSQKTPPVPKSAPPKAGETPSNAGVLTPDARLAFPEFLILSASAGSGKTWALSLRFVQFLLSDRIRPLTRNDLPNIMAMTFTRNAAREMKERILDWLKTCSAPRNEDDLRKVESVLAVVSLSRERLQSLAGEMVDRILAHYSDFQVDTIDHFTGAVFRASAVDLGVSPDFETILEPSETLVYAFQRYLRKIKAGSPEAALFERILELLFRNQRGERAFDWDPAPKVRERVGALYRKLAAQDRSLVVEDLDARKDELEKEITRAAEELGAAVDGSGLEKNTRGHCFTKILPAIEAGDFSTLIGLSFKTPPVRAVPGPSSGRDRVMDLWSRLESLVTAYRPLYARGFYRPYLLAYASFLETLDQVKRQRGVVFIDDINQRLSRYVDQGIVPDIYFRLGDRVFHFLVDEFQDTSPIQWRNLVPLIENSLAQAGSLFVVGDTKQAIYGFREADYRIMSGLEKAAALARGGRETGDLNPFPSVVPEVRNLQTNYRCRREILDFVKAKFLIGPEPEAGKPGKRRPGEAGGDERKNGPKTVLPDKAKYAPYLRESGLDDFLSSVDPKKKEPGHVEYVVLERKGKDAAGDGEGFEDAECDPGDGAGGPAPLPAEEDRPEKGEVQSRVLDLYRRGFALADIAILTFKNDDAARVSSWLNETPWTDRDGVARSGVPFIPFSSLDIRRRRIIAEILALLQFLDSPPDDLSFATFLLGDVFKAKVLADARGDRLAGVPPDTAAWHEFLFDCRLKKAAPLYPAFRRAFPGLWDRYLERLFKIVGYYPLYDLVTLIYRIFDVFDLFAAEEASLTKLLEAIKTFEGQGRNDLREFLEISGDEEGEASDWTIDVPSSIEAVRVMSIHKSKGLTFPAVILLQYAGGSFRPDFLLERDGDAVRVLKLTRDIAAGDPALGPIYEEAYVRDKVGSFNALYVAMTRAADELHVIGVKGRKTEFPFDFLGTVPFVSRHFKDEPRTPEAGRSAKNESPEPEPLPPGWRPPAPKRKPEPEPLPAGTVRFREPFELPLNLRETLNRDNIRRGEIAHALLAGVEFVGPDPAADLAAAQARLAVEADEVPVYDEVRSRLARFLSDPALRPYFEPRPGRTVRTELEVCDRTGRLRRIDRLVVDPGEVFVIEYKTGFPSEPGRLKDWEKEDREVFASYLALMGDVHPGRAVRGALAFIDAGRLEVVG
jgi:ATP-dependent helicase/nuclease subunit A